MDEGAPLGRHQAGRSLISIGAALGTLAMALAVGAGVLGLFVGCAVFGGCGPLGSFEVAYLAGASVLAIVLIRTWRTAQRGHSGTGWSALLSGVTLLGWGAYAAFRQRVTDVSKFSDIDEALLYPAVIPGLLVLLIVAGAMLVAGSVRPGPWRVPLLALVTAAAGAAAWLACLGPITLG